MSFITGTQTEVLYTLPASVTKNTYTTQAVLSAVAGTTPVCTYPAGWLMNDNPNPVGRHMLLKAEGTIGSVTSPTFALALGFDTTVNAIANSITVMAATTTSATTVPWHFEALYTCTAFATSTATFQVNGYFKMEAVASGGAASASALSVGFSGTVAAFNPANAFYLELFGTWSASSASNSTVLQQMVLYGSN